MQYATTRAGSQADCLDGETVGTSMESGPFRDPIASGVMELDKDTMEILRPAADRLRQALRRMESDDVPPPLRPLAESSARRLPPPLLRRALQELEDSEWLRAEVAAESELDPGSPEGLFVDRPDQWESRLRGLIVEVAARRQREDRSQLERELASALNRIEQLERELKAGDREVAAAERKARDRLRSEVEAAERRRKRAETQARQEAHEASRLASRVDRLEAELRSAEDRVDSLRALLEKERRANTPEPVRATRGWFPDDALEMATELDRIFTAARRVPVPDGSEAPDPAGPVRGLPDGVRPDRVDGVRFLMKGTRHWLIDGYNVAYQVADEPTPVTRSRLISAAGRLAGLAAPGSMVVVVFDSSVDTSSLPADRRVRVVYAPSADEWIIEHASDTTVVVSSDRRVREGAETRGAVGLWAEALAEWIGGG